MYAGQLFSTHQYLKAISLKWPLGVGKSSGTHILRAGVGLRSFRSPGSSSQVNQGSHLFSDLSINNTKRRKKQSVILVFLISHYLIPPIIGTHMYQRHCNCWIFFNNVIWGEVNYLTYNNGIYIRDNSPGWRRVGTSSNNGELNSTALSLRRLCLVLHKDEWWRENK